LRLTDFGFMQMSRRIKMIPENETMKIGDKHYLLKDIQEVFDARIKSIPVEEIEMEVIENVSGENL